MVTELAMKWGLHISYPLLCIMGPQHTSGSTWKKINYKYKRNASTCEQIFELQAAYVDTLCFPPLFSHMMKVEENGMAWHLLCFNIQVFHVMGNLEGTIVANWGTTVYVHVRWKWFKWTYFKQYNAEWDQLPHNIFMVVCQLQVAVLIDKCKDDWGGCISQRHV